MDKQLHHEDIREASKRYSDTIVNYYNAGELTDEIIAQEQAAFLHVDIWRNDNSDSVRVEFLLACGGPTVWVTVDIDREDVRFHHSWGWNDAMSREQREVDLYGDLAVAWLDYAQLVSQR